MSIGFSVLLIIFVGSWSRSVCQEASSGSRPGQCSGFETLIVVVQVTRERVNDSAVPGSIGDVSEFCGAILLVPHTCKLWNVTVRGKPGEIVLHYAEDSNRCRREFILETEPVPPSEAKSNKNGSGGTGINKIIY